jgi:chemotaxis protein CheZ
MDSLQKATQLKAARALVIALEADEEKQAQTQLGILAQSQESELFHQVGKLTRELHEALSNFNIDSRLIDLAEKEIPNTRERLNYVITTTEEAAHKTLEFIDQSLPLTSKLNRITEEFDTSWHHFCAEELDTDEFRVFKKEIEFYLPEVKQHSDQIHKNLSEMMLAQGFQDLTGQVISQVISLVEEVENNLVRLVQVSSQHLEHKQKDINPVDPIKAEGPQINTENKPNVVNNQDDVDDLLSSLGF